MTILLVLTTFAYIWLVHYTANMFDLSWRPNPAAEKPTITEVRADKANTRIFVQEEIDNKVDSQCVMSGRTNLKYDNSIYIPAEVVAEYFNCDLEYDKDTNSMLLIKNKGIDKSKVLDKINIIREIGSKGDKDKAEEIAYVKNTDVIPHKINIEEIFYDYHGYVISSVKGPNFEIIKPSETKRFDIIATIKTEGIEDMESKIIIEY